MVVCVWACLKNMFTPIYLYMNVTQQKCAIAVSNYFDVSYRDGGAAAHCCNNNNSKEGDKLRSRWTELNTSIERCSIGKVLHKNIIKHLCVFVVVRLTKYWCFILIIIIIIIFTAEQVVVVVAAAVAAAQHLIGAIINCLIYSFSHCV